MTRALVHIGLAVILAIAPTLCCCTLRGISTGAHAAPAPTSPTSTTPTESCCAKKTSCCHGARSHTPKPLDQTPAPSSCACCTERPDAAQTETKLTVASAEPTGELLSLALVGAGHLEHFGRVRGSHPPDRVGVDARSAALYERHVMRC